MTIQDQNGVMNGCLEGVETLHELSTSFFQYVRDCPIHGSDEKRLVRSFHDHVQSLNDLYHEVVRASAAWIVHGS